MREASKNYESYKRMKESLDECSIDYIHMRDENIPEDNILSAQSSEMNEFLNKESVKTCNINEQVEVLNSREEQQESNTNDESEDSLTNSNKESGGLQDYFLLTKLFA